VDVRGPGGGGGAISVIDTIHDPNAVDPETEAQASELKDRLAGRDRVAAGARAPRVALYYYENLTLREIGEVLGVTESASPSSTRRRAGAALAFSTRP
jgi:RNA polymerase sigma factor for flagellar operon FliA